MSYEAFASRTRSTKIALAHLFPRQRWKQWTLSSGDVYYTTVDHIIEAVHVGVTALTKSDLEPGVNQWRFVPEEKKLYVNVGADPKASNIILTYRFCISTAPLTLPYDLADGYTVEYDALIKDVQELKLELDYENAGIALESTSAITLENTDGYFDGLFDTLIWENQPVKIYAYGLELDPSECRKLFDGFIDVKTFTAKDCKFTLKDQFKRLREKLQLPLYSSLDGTLDDSSLGKPKRRIYGRVKQVKTVGIDKILDGVTLTGTFTGSVGSATVTGVGSTLLADATPDDDVFFDFNGTTYQRKIKSVDSDTQLTLSEVLDVPLISSSLVLKPYYPMPSYNRRWHIAGHKLAYTNTTISEVITNTRLVLADASDLEAGLILSVLGQSPRVERVSLGNLITLDQAVSGAIPIGTPISTSPIQTVYNGSQRLVEGRDYTLTNTSTDAILEIDPLAEFNYTKPQVTTASFTFTNASRTVTCATSGFDLKTVFKPRDWIRADSLTRPTWFEILQVDSSQLLLRAPYSEATYTGNAQRKNLDLINDDSLILVDCNGIQDASGSWLKNASRIIKDILTNDLGATSINTTSFTQAEADAPQLMSYVIPSDVGSSAPVIRDVITDINKSVFGALYQNKTFDFTFSVLQSDKADDMVEISEDEVLSYAVQTKPAIANTIQVNYSPFVDRFSGDNTSEVIQFQNTFVDEMSQIQNTLSTYAFLYRQADATIHAQRLAFLHSVTNAIIQIKGKMNLTTLELGQKVLLNLDRMCRRYGSSDALKIAIVYLLSADESNSTLGVNDFNGMFTRVGSIAPNTALDFLSALGADVAKWGYIVDNYSETPDGLTNNALGNNLIG